MTKLILISASVFLALSLPLSLAANQLFDAPQTTIERNDFKCLSSAYWYAQLIALKHPSTLNRLCPEIAEGIFYKEIAVYGQLIESGQLKDFDERYGTGSSNVVTEDARKAENAIQFFQTIVDKASAENSSLLVSSSNGAVLRKLPDNNSPDVGIVPFGDWVSVVDSKACSDSDWCLVNYDGTKGWLKRAEVYNSAE